jgi:signal transduction histidine kinase
MTYTPQSKSALNFIAGGGEMGARIRAYDWQSSPIGEPETWAQPLKTSLRLLLSSGHPMFIWWGEHLIQFYNDAYASTLGPERHPSALGQEGQDCWAEIWPEIAPQMEQILTGKGHTWHENQRLFITRNGVREEMYWTYSYSPIDDPNSANGIGGILVVCNETTEQVLAEQAMKTAEARWRSLFDQAPSFMCIVQGPEHRFEYANLNYFKLLGKRDFLGEKVIDVVPEVDAQGFIALLDKVFESGESHHGIEMPLIVGNGAPTYIDFIYQPIMNASGHVSGILVEGNNVTERVLANRSLQEQDKLKDEFLAMLAHELRNPLAPIRNVSEILINMEQRDPKLKNIGDILARQVRHMTHLMDDLLDVSRISQNLINLQLEPTDFSDIVSLTIESLQSALDAKHHTLELVVTPEALHVNGDSTRLVQSLSNVLNNAIKYTPDGGHITLECVADTDTVQVIISDNGCGICPSMQGKVFELFAQVQQTLDRSQGGLGIGLNIVQRLVQMHGGTISVSSQGLGHGSCFTITLPRISAPKNTAVEAAFALNTAKRVLIVDDNKDSADTLSELLEIQGHTVTTVYNAHDALSDIENIEPDVVLLDIGLPDMNGYEVAQQILAKKLTPLLVALTGYGQAEDVRKAKEVGFDYHFTKPVNFSELNQIFAQK